MFSTIVVATSIVPRNIDHQKSAIDSWLSFGFDVISINSPSEIEAVQSYFPAVKFVTADRTAEPETGKPYIYFDDVLKALADTGADICGIINSDIILKSTCDLKKVVLKQAAKSFLFASRIDVKEAADSDGELYFGGFDVFFFDKSVISSYPVSGFCLGAPWWDYWAPIVPLIKGIPCKIITSPFAYHLWHETNWVSALHDKFKNEIISTLSNISLEENSKLSQRFSDVVETGNSSHFPFIILKFIISESLKNSLTNDEIAYNNVLIGLRQYNSMLLDMIDRRIDYCIDVNRLTSDLEKILLSKKNRPVKKFLRKISNIMK